MERTKKNFASNGLVMILVLQNDMIQTSNDIYIVHLQFTLYNTVFHKPVTIVNIRAGGYAFIFINLKLGFNIETDFEKAVF